MLREQGAIGNVVRDFSRIPVSPLFGDMATVLANYVDGQEKPSAASSFLDVISPATQDVLCRSLASLCCVLRANLSKPEVQQGATM
eukprot:2063115-Rhodomonas_salina.2